jgi:hypothetical protein
MILKSVKERNYMVIIFFINKIEGEKFFFFKEYNFVNEKS